MHQLELATLDKNTLALAAFFIDQLEDCEDPRAFHNTKKLQGIDNGSIPIRTTCERNRHASALPQR